MTVDRSRCRVQKCTAGENSGTFSRWCLVPSAALWPMRADIAKNGAAPMGEDVTATLVKQCALQHVHGVNVDDELDVVFLWDLEVFGGGSDRRPKLFGVQGLQQNVKTIFAT